MTPAILARTAGPAALAGLLSLAIAQVPAGAQSSLSGQGFGYPPGQLSTRSIAIGGANAELDPVSPRNPASVSAWGAPGLHLQYDPEFRRVEVGGGDDRTVTARFPLISGATQLGRSFAVSASISTVLDRTWATTSADTSTVAGSQLITNTVFSSAGGMNDVRLAAAWTVRPSFRVGLAGHAITGENRVTIRSTFSDPNYTPLTQQTEVSYSGITLSGGMTWRPMAAWAVGASGRIEGPLRGTRAGQTVTSARIPSRMGASVAYTGLTGAVLTLAGNLENWTALDGLGSDAVRTQDTREIGVGAEFDGPSVRSTALTLRLGGRWRDLPFAAQDHWVRENAIAGGIGLPLANIGGLPRATVDLATQRSTRSGPPGVRETAWTLSVGLTVRP